MRSVVVVDTMGGLGDLLLTLPSIDALARSHPAARLVVVTTAPWHALLERDPRIAAVVPVPGRDEAAILGAVTPVLERERPDLAVTTNRQHGLPELLERTAARAITDLWRRPPADEPVDLRFLRLLADDGVVDDRFRALPPALVLDREEVAAGAEVLDGLGASRPILLLPDSGMAVKQWPLASWSSVVRGLIAAGEHPVVVSQVAEQRAALAAAGAVVAPPLRIRGLAGLAAGAAGRGGRAVGGDTGPLRVASAAGLPVVGLFGPTVAGRYGYRASGAVNLQGFPGCPVRTPTAITEQECWWSARCPLAADHAPACMGAITEEQVLARLHPNGPASPSRGS